MPRWCMWLELVVLNHQLLSYWAPGLPTHCVCYAWSAYVHEWRIIHWEYDRSRYWRLSQVDMDQRSYFMMHLFFKNGYGTLKGILSWVNVLGVVNDTYEGDATDYYDHSGTVSIDLKRCLLGRNTALGDVRYESYVSTLVNTVKYEKVRPEEIILCDSRQPNVRIQCQSDADRWVNRYSSPRPSCQPICQLGQDDRQ
jgi:hypothetical protein